MSQVTYRVTEVSPEFNDWHSQDGSTHLRYFKFKYTASDGTSGVGSFGRKLDNGTATPPEVGFEFIPKSATFDSKSGEMKFKGVQTPEQFEKYGNSSSGPAGSSDDKMRSKEQCMRGEAVIAASGVAASAADAILYAQTIYKYIESGETTMPLSAAQPASAPASSWSESAPPAEDKIPF